ncbi:hypothetical protein AeMF1_010242 [Aphanomyces euteiches]|nr:hypothetical protein AeMF1_010242 [Aphanomyces euteiches]KAH9192602.1 hypothetical protein AeNC1_005433 [Aphanomyces euteiches]
MGRHTKTKKAKKRRAAPTECSKDVVIQKCPGKSTRACAITRGRKRSCRVIRFSGAHGTYQRMRSRGTNGTVLQIRKARRSRTTKIEYIPPGVVDLIGDSTSSLGWKCTTLCFQRGCEPYASGFVNIPPYPSITLPNSMEAIYIEESPVSSLDPTDWRNVPLKTLYVTHLNGDLIQCRVFSKSSIETFDRTVFPPSITTLQIRETKVKTLATSTLPTSVVAMNLEHNEISSVESVPMTNLHSLLYLSIGGNPIQTLGNRSRFPSGLRNLSMAECQISNISADVEFPPNLLSLDLSGNKLESFPFDKLPQSLRELDLEGNPLKEFNIDNSAVLDQLRNLSDFDATTDHVKCNPPYIKTNVRGKIFACAVSKARKIQSGESIVQGASASASKSSSTTLVLVVVLACLVVAMFALLFVVHILRRRRGRLTDQTDMEAADESLRSVMASYKVQGFDDSVFHPTHLDTSLKERFIYRHRIDDYVALVGNISSGILRGQRIMIMALPKDGDEATARLLVRIVHPNISTFHGFSCGFENELAIVTEWMDGGNLDAILAKPKEWNAFIKLAIAQDVTDALVMGQTKLSLRGGIEPADLVWIAPEYVKGNAVSNAADVYAFGVLLLTLWNHAVPSISTVVEETQLSVNRGKLGQKIIKMTVNRPQSLRELTAQCLERDPSRRASVVAVQNTLRTIKSEIEAKEMTNGDDVSTILGLSVLDAVMPAMSFDVPEPADAMTQDDASTVLALSVLDVVEPAASIDSSASANVDSVIAAPPESTWEPSYVRVDSITVAPPESTLASSNHSVTSLEVEAQSEPRNMSTAVSATNISSANAIVDLT